MAVSGTEGARQGRLRGPTLAAAGSRRSTGSRQVLPAAAAGTRSRKALQLVQEEQTQNLQVHTACGTVGAAGTRHRKSSGAHCGCSCFQKSPGGTVA